MLKTVGVVILIVGVANLVFLFMPGRRGAIVVALVGVAMIVVHYLIAGPVADYRKSDHARQNSR